MLINEKCGNYSRKIALFPKETLLSAIYCHTFKKTGATNQYRYKIDKSIILKILLVLLVYLHFLL